MSIKDGYTIGSKRLTKQKSMDGLIRSACDILRRGNCASALQYVPELTWILFLRILDEREHREQQEAEALGIPFRPSLEAPYRWQDRAAPEGEKRKELQEGALGDFFAFVNGREDHTTGEFVGLLPYLKALKDRPNSTPRQKVISEIISGVERWRNDTQRKMLVVLERGE